MDPRFAAPLTPVPAAWSDSRPSTVSDSASPQQQQERTGTAAGGTAAPRPPATLVTAALEAAGLAAAQDSEDEDQPAQYDISSDEGRLVGNLIKSIQALQFPSFQGGTVSPLTEDEAIYASSSTASDHRNYSCKSIINFLELFEQRLDTLSVHISTTNLATLLVMALNVGCIGDAHCRVQFGELAMQAGVRFGRGANVSVDQYLAWRSALVMTFTPDTFMGELDRALTAIHMGEQETFAAFMIRYNRLQDRRAALHGIVRHHLSQGEQPTARSELERTETLRLIEALNTKTRALYDAEDSRTRAALRTAQALTPGLLQAAGNIPGECMGYKYLVNSLRREAAKAESAAFSSLAAAHGAVYSVSTTASGATAAATQATLAVPDTAAAKAAYPVGRKHAGRRGRGGQSSDQRGRGRSVGPGANSGNGDRGRGRDDRRRDDEREHSYEGQKRPRFNPTCHFCKIAGHVLVDCRRIHEIPNVWTREAFGNQPSHTFTDTHRWVNGQRAKAGLPPVQFRQIRSITVQSVTVPAPEAVTMIVDSLHSGANSILPSHSFLTFQSHSHDYASVGTDKIQACTTALSHDGGHKPALRGNFIEATLKLCHCDKPSPGARRQSAVSTMSDKQSDTTITATWQIDGGAEGSCIALSLVQQLAGSTRNDPLPPQIQHSDATAVSASGALMPLLGTVKIDVSTTLPVLGTPARTISVVASMDFMVFEDKNLNCPILLGYDWVDTVKANLGFDPDSGKQVVSATALTPTMATSSGPLIATLPATRTTVPLWMVEPGTTPTVLWDSREHAADVDGRTTGFASAPPTPADLEMTAAIFAADNAAPFTTLEAPISSLDDVKFGELVTEANILHASLSPAQRAKLLTLLIEYKDVFARSPSDLVTPAKFPLQALTGIDVTKVPRLPRYTPHHSQAEKAAADRQIQEWITVGIVEKCQSEADYLCAHNLLCAPKGPKKDAYRVCVDMRLLNVATASDATIMPNADDVLQRLHGGNIFSSLDLASGYLQIAMDDESRKYLAFRTEHGVFRFTRLPFGLKNACALFNKLLRSAEQEAGISHLSANYFDDTNVASISFGEHLDTLTHIFKFYRDRNLKVNLSKCVFGAPKIKALGHIVSAAGLEPDPAKIDAIRDLPAPTTTKQLQSFLGLCNYYRRFVPSFSSFSAPLTDLVATTTAKNFLQQWTATAQQAFERVKTALCDAECLALFDASSTSMLIIDSDASDVGIGAILSQWCIDPDDPSGQQRILRPVAYISRKLSKAERNYSVTERELLAIVFATLKWRAYLLGRQVQVRTDHSALRYILRARDLQGRVARWLIHLGAFDLTIVHRPGVENANADCLSRMPVNQDDDDIAADYDNGDLGMQTSVTRNVTGPSPLIAFRALPIHGIQCGPVLQPSFVFVAAVTRSKTRATASDRGDRFLIDNGSAPTFSSPVHSATAMELDSATTSAVVEAQAMATAIGDTVDAGVLSADPYHTTAAGPAASATGTSAPRRRAAPPPPPPPPDPPDDDDVADDLAVEAGYRRLSRRFANLLDPRESKELHAALLIVQRDGHNVLQQSLDTMVEPDDAVSRRKLVADAKFYDIRDDGSIVFIDPDAHPRSRTRFLVVPELALREEIILRAHILGHFGVRATLERVHGEFHLFWPKMFEDVDIAVRSCPTCASYRRAPMPQHPARASQLLPGLFQTVAIDLVFGFPPSPPDAPREQQFRGILVLTEFLTKYAVAFPIRCKAAKEIAPLLLHYIALFGAPTEILSDQGPEFLNALVATMFEGLGIEHRVASPWHPRTNGSCERTNAILVHMLEKHVKDDPAKWPQYLDYVLFAYRTKVHTATGFTPFSLMFGREHQSICRSFLEDLGASHAAPSAATPSEQALVLRQRVDEIRRLVEVDSAAARSNLQRAKTRQRRQQDSRHSQLHEEPLQPGTVVYVRVPNHTNRKFTPPFVGPYKIDRQETANGKYANYFLRTPSGALLLRKYPLDQLFAMTSDLAAERIWGQVTTGTKRNDIIYDAECVLDHRPSQSRPGKMEYMLRWTGFPTDFDSWEKEESLISPKLLHDYFGFSAAAAQQSGAHRSTDGVAGDCDALRVLHTRCTQPHLAAAATASSDPLHHQFQRGGDRAFVAGLDSNSLLHGRLGSRRDKESRTVSE